MKMVVAELCSKMGFDIDTTQLDKLDGHIKTMRASSTLLARNLRVLNSQLNTTKTNLNGVTKSLDSVSSKKNVNGLAGGYTQLATNARNAEAALARFGRVLGLVEPRVTSFNTRMVTLTGTWANYVDKLRAANKELTSVKNNSAAVRAAPTVIGGGRGSASGGGRGAGAAGALGIGAAVSTFMNPFTPTGLLVGGAATAGVATKELVKAGREVQKMRQAMLVATGSAQGQAEALKFVDEQAQRLGVSYTEMGKAYAQAKIATEGKLSTEQLERMMKGVSEFSTTMHLSADDQKGVFRAVTQMFSKGKISLEEVNQLAERGIPALKLMQEASKKFYKVDDEGFQKMIQKGQIITKDIFPMMADMMAEMARKGGALDKAINSSTAAQQRLVNEWKKFSYEVMDSGLDQALGVLFNSLADLLKVAVPFGKGLGEAAVGLLKFLGVIKDFVTENPKLIASLGVIIGLFIMKGRTAKGAGSMVNQFFVLLLSNIGKLKVVLTRFPLLAMFMALFEVFRAFGQYMKGEDNWLTFLGKEIAITVLRIELLIERIKTLYVTAKQGIVDLLTDNVITNAWEAITDRLSNPFANSSMPPPVKNPPFKPTMPQQGIPTKGTVVNPFMRGQAVVDLQIPNQPTQRIVVPMSTQGQIVNTGGLRK